jgi:large subunit ribosomal protein L3
MTVGFAKKIGMTRLFIEGRSVPVTALEFGDNRFIQKKTLEKDGYVAVQLGAFEKKTESTKPRVGHIAKHAESGMRDFYCLKEFKISVPEDKKGTDFSELAVGVALDITGTTKGHGFTGVVKRHGFAGQPASHGHDHERAPGSIGSRWPQMTVRGKKMAGHDGNTQQTVKNLEVVARDEEQKLFFVAGSVPGPTNGFVSFASAKNN